MLKLPVKIVTALLLISASLGCAATTLDRTIAKINDDILTESDLAEVRADGAGKFRIDNHNGFDGATSQTVMSVLDRALLLQEARRLKISPTADEMNRQVEEMVREIRANFSSDKEFHQALASERLSLDQLKQELIEKSKTDYQVFHVISSRYSVSDNDVQQFEQAKSQAGEDTSSYRLRRLGVPASKGSEQEAMRKVRDIVTRIIQEGISFEEGIRKYSQVPGAEIDAGDLGYMSADKLNSDVRAAVEKLEIGQASRPVLAGGYANIFYLENKHGAKSALREERFFQAKETLLKDLRRKAVLRVFDQRLQGLLPEEYLGSVTKALPASPRPSEASAAVSPQPPSPTATPAPRGLKSWFGAKR